MHEHIAIIKWYLKGKPSPTPHAVKQRMIRKNRRGRNILVETGTYLGEMVEAMRATFQKIYSIELDGKLYSAAKEKFRRDPSVEIVNGDSGEIVQTLLPKIKKPAVFWLDGHYSGGVTSKASLNTPIYRELESIFAHSIKGHMILIDDARLFVGENDYPTLDELDNFISQKTKHHTLVVANDMIRITYQ